MNETDPKCTDLTLVHGELQTMECLHPWSDERYENTTNPYDLSGMYKLTFADGAELTVGSLYAYALAQGSFWLIEDPTDKATSVFVREDRALAYFASKGSILQRDREGLCELPSQSEADAILADFGVPDEALKFGSEEVLKGFDAWGDKWLKQGLVKKDEEGKMLTMVS